MKKNLLFLSILLALFLSGCGNNQVKEENRDLTPVKNKEYKNLPAWVLQPDYKDGIAAVGQAKIGVAGMAFAKQEALAMARGELSRMIEVQVDDMFKSYINSVGVGGEDGLDKVATSVSSQVSSNSIKGSKQVDIWISETNELYVLVGVPFDSLKATTASTINSTLQNDNALWQEFKAQKAQDELNSAINNKFKK